MQTGNSFRSRLARLEALEALQGARESPGPLTAEDCAVLLGQIVLFNVKLGVDGRVTRTWDCQGAEVNAHLDTALLRLNALLVAEPDPPHTVRELALGLAQYVPDQALPDWLWGTLFERFPLIEEPTHEDL